MSAEQPISLLQQREIEAKIIGPLFQAFAKELGEDRATQILAGVIRELAQTSGCTAANTVGGNDLAHLGRVVDTWRQADALTLDVLRRDEEALEFNVTRCRFAEMYLRLGLEKLGPLLSCNRDAAMIEGFNPEVEFKRTQTLMEGASHCDFRYHRLADQRINPTERISPHGKST